LQTPVQEENTNRENHGWGKFQIDPRYHWQTENYHYQNPSSINAMTPNFKPIHYPTQEVKLIFIYLKFMRKNLFRVKLN
jgi:hypothetical protein